MLVVILTYHLRACGVTNVIEMQSEALKLSKTRHVILSGSDYEGSFDLPIAIVEELDYLCQPETSNLELYNKLKHITNEYFKEDPDIWYIHNPTIGINIIYPKLIEELATRKERIVLHVHDFAEDGRPNLYENIINNSNIYPIAPQIVYCVINSRDYEILLQAGVATNNLYLLPNAVKSSIQTRRDENLNYTAPNHTSIDFKNKIEINSIGNYGRNKDDMPQKQQITVLYPVRGVRRKNLGELCLLSVLAPSNVRFALTKAPKEKSCIPFYNFWNCVIHQLNLPLHLGVTASLPPASGLDATYETWVQYSQYIVTTSIAEGFGLAYLESLLTQKPIFGRDLPEITRDFKNQSIEFNYLYKHILVPKSWIDICSLKDELYKQLQSYHMSYNQEFCKNTVENVWKTLQLINGDFLDYGNLPESFQFDILQKVVKSETHANEIMVLWQNKTVPIKEWINHALQQKTKEPEQMSLYSLSSYEKSLMEILLELNSRKVKTPTWLNKTMVLKQFMKPERFHFLRTKSKI